MIIIAVYPSESMGVVLVFSEWCFR